MITMSHAEWLAEGEKRFGPDPRKWVFVCPACKTPQSADDFYSAGFERGKGEVNKYLGYSCVGRFNGGRKGCNWTLAGLLQIHALTIVTEDGAGHPHFVFGEPLSQEKAA